MSDIVIRAENLSKKYVIGHQRAMRYETFSDEVAAQAKNWARRLIHPLRSSEGGLMASDEQEDFYALRGVNFEIKRGGRVGIIGRNGAGKSTLLKILSRITEPTDGRVTLKGRVASLLEIGTGFHPELTGRENIFLNGAMLGMHKAEIQKKFDEIVAFAEVEKFLDTPVKRYSSGMYVRLAFAVAAHLESEVLIVDEVLAVGDMQFQKKCLGKMDEVGREGRTVLLVSHNMGVIKRLATQCIFLDQGEVVNIGESKVVIDQYLRSQIASIDSAECFFEEALNKEFQLLRARLVNAHGDMTREFSCDDSLIIQLETVVHQKIPGLYGYLSLDKIDGEVVMVSDSNDHVLGALGDLSVGRHAIDIIVPSRTIAAGEYSVYLNFTSNFGVGGFNIDSPGRLFTFNIADHTTRRGNSRDGYFSTCLEWRVQEA